VSLLPLFPLPNVVLFPDVLLPLHIFEPRYRDMVADALESDRRIGMVLLRAGHESEYEGRPPVYDVGCSGVMVHSSRLEDGRYNIVLRGLDRFRVVSENHERAYRRAIVAPLSDPVLDTGAHAALKGTRAAIESRLGLMKATSDDLGPSLATQLAAMPDEDFVHTLAHYLDFEPIEKQMLLERASILQRAEALAELLEMKHAHSTLPNTPDVRH